MKNLSPGLRNPRPQLLSVLPITLRPPSRLGRRKKRRRNERDVTEKEGLRIPPQPLGPIVPALAKKKVKKTAPTVKTQARSPVETVAKRDTTLTSTPNHPSQKTSVSLGNLRVSDWC